MSVKVVMAPLTGGGADRAVLDSALVLAQRFDAHIDATFMKADPRDMLPYIGGEGMPSSVLEELIERSERDSADQARQARTRFDAWREAARLPLADRRSPAKGPSCGWHEFVGRPYQDWAPRGRLADVLVIPRGEAADGAEPSYEFESAVMESGRPVLLPPVQTVANFGSRIVVAWDGGAESARAVLAARPFLARADKVTILQITESSKKAASVDGLVDYLFWHDIAAETRTEAPGDRDIGEALLAEAAREKADLLVMGAYSHSRLREMVFGGATRYVLDGADLHVLMVH